MHKEKNSEESLHHSGNYWSNFLKYSSHKKKKKNSRSKSMFEITENPYADDNCCCCGVNNNNMTTRNSINSSLVYSLLTTSINNHSSLNPSSSTCLFLLKFSQVLISSGAPSHRLDYCLQLLLEKLNVKAQFGYFPGFLVVSFENLAASVQIIKAESILDLHKLTQAYQLFESLLCDEVSIEEAIQTLDLLSRAPTLYPVWLTWLAYAVSSSASTPLFFSGGAVDMAFGLLLGFIVALGTQHISKKVTRFSSIFDVLLSAVVGFLAATIAARFPSTTSCFYALSIGGVVSILPGYTTLVSILEIAAGEIASGTLRLITSLVYSLLIGFGLAIGASIHKIIFPALELISADTQQCENGISPYYHIAFVPMFAIANTIILKGHPSKFPIILSLAALAHCVHFFGLQWFVTYQHVATVLAAFSVAIISNIYARIRPTVGFVDMITGLLFLVPGSVGVASSISTFTSKVHTNELNIILNAGSQGVIFATHMMIITVSVSVGLVLAAAVIYPIRKIVDYRRKTCRYRRRNWVGEITF
ncbi:hypothetical protein MFLAVUS_000173 [Mucor flavus]|uniref:Threonine/serine exporter-like N-terminal domain-containing protein n=1 Tax=Mucor flavus TaxID=439312 RepID=A0ABP9YIZ0_9FUNG